MRYIISFSCFVLCFSLYSCSQKASKTAASTPTPPVKIEIDNTPIEKAEDTPSMPEEIEKAEEVKSPVMVAMIKKTPCFGKCPVFEAKLYSDGTAEYKGIKFVEREGNYIAKSGVELVRLVKEQVQSIDYFNLETTYPSNGKLIMDIPNTITKIQMDGKSHSITNNHNAPTNLQEFEKYLLEKFESLNWEKAN